jgi:hypothetical protein
MENKVAFETEMYVCINKTYTIIKGNEKRLWARK